MSISLRKENEEMIRTLVRSGRRPHTVIIEGDSKEERDGAALMLAASAVCTSPDKPCLSCNPCRKVLEGQHPDLIIPAPSKRLKSGIISLSELRDEYLSQVSIKPNEADTKIYLFYDADRLLREQEADIYIFDFHAEATSEKNAFGYFLAGRASAVFGTHTHVQTADERVLRGYTGYITDLGMTGGSDSVIGVVPEHSVAYFRGEQHLRFEPSESGMCVCGALFELGADGACASVTRIRHTKDK